MGRKVTVAAMVLAVAGVVGLGAQATKQKVASLYDRLGGKMAIVAVVDDFVGNCAADKRINAFFAATAGDPARLAKFKGNLVDQICEAAGGPCKYTGKDMKTAHAGMNIKDADFGALVDDLKVSLAHFDVGAKEQADLLGALARMHDDIVTAK